MAIVFDNSASAKTTSTTLSFNFTIGGGANRLLVVGVCVRDSEIGGVSFDSRPLAFVWFQQQGSIRVYLYYMLDINLPSTAGTYLLEVFGGATLTNLEAGATSVSGARQAGFEAYATSGLNSTTSISTSVTSITAGAWAFDVVGTAASSITTLTASSGQTKRQQQDNNLSDVGVSTKVLASAGSSSLGWTFNTSGDAAQVIGVFAPASGGADPPGPRDIITRVIKITTPGTTGNKAYTGVGFRGKAVLFWGVPVKDTNINIDAAQWIGMADNFSPTPRQKVVKVAGQNGAMHTHRSADGATAIAILRADNDTPVVVGTLVSWDADGFTINFTSAEAGYIIYALIFGGTDLSAFVGQTAADAAGGAVTGVPFSPDLALCITFCQTLDSTLALDNGSQAFGAFDRSLNKWWVGSYQGTNSANQNFKDSHLRTTGLIGQASVGAIDWEITPTAMTSNGFTWSGSNTDGFYFLLLGFNGGRARVGTFNKSTSAAPAFQTLPDPGWKPQAYLLASAVKNGQGVRADSSEAAPGSRVTIGAFDGSGKQFNTLRTDINNTQNADQRASDTRVLGLGSLNAVYEAEGKASQILTNTPQIEWNPNDTNARIIGYVEIEVGTITFVDMAVTVPATSGVSANVIVTNSMSVLIPTQMRINPKLSGGVGIESGELEIPLDAASVQTSDNTVTTLYSRSIAPSTALYGSFTIGARNTHVAGQMQTWQIDFMATSNEGLVAQTAGISVGGQAGWSVVLDEVGSTVRVRVQGPAATTLRWSCVLRGHQVNQPVAP